MDWIKPPDEFATPHFHYIRELACKHCGLVPSVSVMQATAGWLERLRHALGDHPISVNSAARCETHNKAVGGATNSEHMRGFAADITVRDLSPRQVQKLCRQLQKEGMVGGLGSYKSWSHVDRGTIRSWVGP